MKKGYLNICQFVIHSWLKRNKKKQNWLTVGICRLSFSLTPLLVISVIQIGHKCWSRNNYVLSRVPFLNCATPSQWFSPNFKSPPYWRHSVVVCLSNWILIFLFRHLTLNVSTQLFGKSKITLKKRWMLRDSLALLVLHPLIHLHLPFELHCLNHDFVVGIMKWLPRHR